jgi:single-strand DNA-binding protein
MASVNKAIIIGNLGRDPEIRFMPDGAAIGNLNIATTEKWKDKQTGEAKEATEWHRVVVRGRLAEIANEYLKKGSPCYIEGSIKTRKWTNKDGIEQYTTEIVAHSLQLIGSREASQAPSQPKPAAKPPSRDIRDMSNDIPDDGIPF